MENLALGRAVLTGVVATVCVAVSLTWWRHPDFAHRSDTAVLVVAFLLGLIGWFMMFGIVLAYARGSVLAEFLSTWKSPKFLLLWAWLGLLVVVAIVDASAGAKAAGKWGADPAWSRPGCHWPLSANHDTEHACVSHARWLTVNLATARVFVGFGTAFLVIACAVLTTLSRQFRRNRKPAAAHASP